MLLLHHLHNELFAHLIRIWLFLVLSSTWPIHGWSLLSSSPLMLSLKDDFSIFRICTPLFQIFAGFWLEVETPHIKGATIRIQDQIFLKSLVWNETGLKQYGVIHWIIKWVDVLQVIGTWINTLFINSPVIGVNLINTQVIRGTSHYSGWILGKIVNNKNSLCISIHINTFYLW